MEDVHLHRGHAVDVALDDLDRLEVAAHVDHQSAPGKARLVLNVDEREVVAVAIAGDELQQRLHAAHRAHTPYWRSGSRGRRRSPARRTRPRQAWDTLRHAALTAIVSTAAVPWAQRPAATRFRCALRAAVAGAESPPPAARRYSRLLATVNEPSSFSFPGCICTEAGNGMTLIVDGAIRAGLAGRKGENRQQ